ALLLDAREDRPAAILELAQIREARLERAQLRVVQAARDLLPIACDERHGRAFVEQRDGRLHLGRGGTDLVGDGAGDSGRERDGFGHGFDIEGRLRPRAAILASPRRARKALTVRRACAPAFNLDRLAASWSCQRPDRKGMVPESRISEILAAESEPDGAGGLSGMRLR